MHDDSESSCRCGDLVEEVDSGNGYTYWAHVNRSRVDHDHAAVPRRIPTK